MKFCFLETVSTDRLSIILKNEEKKNQPDKRNKGKREYKRNSEATYSLKKMVFRVGKGGVF